MLVMLYCGAGSHITLPAEGLFGQLYCRSVGPAVTETCLPYEPAAAGKQNDVREKLGEMARQRSRLKAFYSAMVKLAPRPVRNAAKEVHDATLEYMFDTVDRKIESLVTQTFKKMQDVSLLSACPRTVSIIGMFRAELDPWTPKFFAQFLEHMWRTLWPEISDAVKEDLLEDKLKTTKLASKDVKLERKDAKQVRGTPVQGLHSVRTHCLCISADSAHQTCPMSATARVMPVQVWSWPPPPAPWPGMLAYCRAKFIYAIMPADKPIWWVIQQPIALVFFLLALFPVGLSILPLTAMLCCIDRSDEYQVPPHSYFVLLEQGRATPEESRCALLDPLFFEPSSAPPALTCCFSCGCTRCSSSTTCA
eukprot:1273345-Pleurochrysis_carterae.AAC.8